jgi:RNA-directed DNA polymerase
MAEAGPHRLLCLPRRADQLSLLGAFRDHVVRLWGRTLRRRSQKHALTWERMGQVADDWLPQPHILHPWPSIRFAVKHLR